MLYLHLGQRTSWLGLSCTTSDGGATVLLPVFTTRLYHRRLMALPLRCSSPSHLYARSCLLHYTVTPKGTAVCFIHLCVLRCQILRPGPEGMNERRAGRRESGARTAAAPRGGQRRSAPARAAPRGGRARREASPADKPGLRVASASPAPRRPPHLVSK